MFLQMCMQMSLHSFLQMCLQQCVHRRMMVTICPHLSQLVSRYR
ncbi:hypothetical protein N566_01670 [Streptomycetaceae bacterium MP113-05]|nr:hypothetical protein N566_01670 [Streptomycetaceae bacterium MP113-05]